MAEADPQFRSESSKRAKLTPAFAVRLAAFLRVKPFVSDEETRYYLNGIAVQPDPDGGAICVATDGHRLGARRDEQGLSFRPVIVKVPRELKIPRKTLLPNPWIVCMEAGGKGHISVVAADKNPEDDIAETAIGNIDDCIIRFGDTVIDGTFPEWRKVVPEADGQERGFNGDYLSSFGHALNIRGKDAESPHLVRDGNDPDFVGVLMPMRVPLSASGVPAWTRTPQASA